MERGEKKSIIRYVNSWASRRSHIPDRSPRINSFTVSKAPLLFFFFLSFSSLRFFFPSSFFSSPSPLSSIFMTRSKQSSRGYENGTKLFLSFHGQPLEFNKTLSFSLFLSFYVRKRERKRSFLEAH